MKNDRLIKALLRQPTDRTPIWVMRQAGRYLPEYRQVRAEAGSFMNLCQNPELACEVTMQPLRRYDLDAAILFSDILTIPDAMGLGLKFMEGEGPVFERPIRCAEDVDRLIVPHPEAELDYVLKAVSTIQSELKQRCPLIGFSGSPWTLACYMIEGGSSRDFKRIQALMYQQPKVLHQLLDKLADAVILYLNAQIEAGVNAVQIFDTWGGILPSHAYQTFSLSYMEKICRSLISTVNEQRIPKIVFTKNGGLWLEKIADIGCEAIGLDWTVDLNSAKERVGNKVALQGNLNPTVLLQTKDVIEHETKRVLSQFGAGTGHVFNLGHGITPDVSPDNMKVLVDTVTNYSLNG